MYEVKAYRCSYCSKLHGQKANCKRHEVKCFFNPDTRSCASCDSHKFDFDDGNHCLKNAMVDDQLMTKCESYTIEEH